MSIRISKKMHLHFHRPNLNQIDFQPTEIHLIVCCIRKGSLRRTSGTKDIVGSRTGKNNPNPLE